jgi:c-di-GMP-binding flagellar brake protein YcgR
MATNYDGTEKRKHLRVDWKAPVQVTRDDTAAEGEIRNISLGGILITSELDLKYGERVTVQFSVPKMQDPVFAECTVRWISAEKEQGLNFVGLKAIETWAISQLMRQLSGV